MSEESEQAIEEGLAQENYDKELPWWDPNRYPNEGIEDE